MRVVENPEGGWWWLSTDNDPARHSGRRTGPLNRSPAVHCLGVEDRPRLRRARWIMHAASARSADPLSRDHGGPRRNWGRIGRVSDEWTVERHLEDKAAHVVALYHRFIDLAEACGPFDYAVAKSAVSAHHSGVNAAFLRSPTRGSGARRPTRAACSSTTSG